MNIRERYKFSTISSHLVSKYLNAFFTRQQWVLGTDITGQAGDSDYHRAPGLTFGFYVSMNVPCNFCAYVKEQHVVFYTALGQLQSCTDFPELLFYNILIRRQELYKTAGKEARKLIQACSELVRETRFRILTFFVVSWYLESS